MTFKIILSCQKHFSTAFPIFQPREIELKRPWKIVSRKISLENINFLSIPNRSQKFSMLHLVEGKKRFRGDRKRQGGKKTFEFAVVEQRWRAQRKRVRACRRINYWARGEEFSRGFSSSNARYRLFTKNSRTFWTDNEVTRSTSPGVSRFQFSVWGISRRASVFGPSLIQINICNFKFNPSHRREPSLSWQPGLPGNSSPWRLIYRYPDASINKLSRVSQRAITSLKFFQYFSLFFLLFW